MKIKVNGKDQELNKISISVFDLLSENEIQNTSMVSVQLNGKFVKKEEFNTVEVKDNDEIDFLFFMGGGKYSSFNGENWNLTGTFENQVING
jgi:sulfur carrier protein